MASETKAAPQAAYDFFVSYRNVSPDKAWAEWMAWALEEKGHKVLLQAWDFLPGQNIVALMHEGVEKASRTLFVLSPRYFSSVWTQAEWTAVLSKDPTGKDGRFVPFRIEDFEAPGLFGPLNYVDLFGKDEDAARQLLLDSLKGTRRKPPTSPMFPGAAHAADRAAPPFPGSLPPHWNVPFPRNLNFSGRGDLLARLEASLAEGKTTVLTQVMHGLGGIGKTQTAVEYAYRRASAYRIVWWLPSETEAGLAAAYADLGRGLGVAVPDANDQRALVSATRERLLRERRWLLIFDNVEDPALIRPYIPTAGEGHVLVTSRSHDWGSLGKPVDVGVLDPDAAKEFLLKRTDQQDAEAARALAEELGFFPLSLAQAAGYVATNKISLRDYLALYRERREALWKREKPPADYPGSVAETFDLSLERLRATAPHALHLLHLLAFLAPDNVPRSILPKAAEHVPPEARGAFADLLDLHESIAHLQSLGLVTATPENVSTHRVVQLSVRDRLGDQQDAWVVASVSLTTTLFQFKYGADDHRMAELAPLLPHAMAATDVASSRPAQVKGISCLLVRIAAYQFTLGRLEPARSCLQDSLSLDEKMYGKDHPTIATNLSNLSVVLKDLGDAPQAKTLLERALAIDEKAYEKDHPTFAIHLANLALVLQTLGDIPQAKTLLEHALSIDEKAYEKDHPTIATHLTNLAMVLQDLGDAPQAKALLERALTIDEKTYGKDHPRVAITVGNLALVLKSLGNHRDAKPLLERALRTFLKFYPENHRYVKETRRRLERL